jgi:hypothetical protein
MKFRIQYVSIQCATQQFTHNVRVFSLCMSKSKFWQGWPYLLFIHQFWILHITWRIQPEIWSILLEFLWIWTVFGQIHQSLSPGYSFFSFEVWIFLTPPTDNPIGSDPTIVISYWVTERVKNVACKSWGLLSLNLFSKYL